MSTWNLDVLYLVLVMRWIGLHCRNWFLSNNYCTSLPVYLNWSFILHFDLISVLLVLVNIHLVSSIGYFNDGLKQVYVLGDECDKQKNYEYFCMLCFSQARNYRLVFWGQRHKLPILTNIATSQFFVPSKVYFDDEYENNFH